MTTRVTIYAPQEHEVEVHKYNSPGEDIIDWWIVAKNQHLVVTIYGEQTLEIKEKA